MLLSLPISLLTFALPPVFADVQFTYPPAGAAIPVGTIVVQWRDSGKAPSTSSLTQYTLGLIVGGNGDQDMLQLATFVADGSFASGNNASGTIPAGISGPVPNGFFLRMTSAAASGGDVINFSDRFTITGLTGSIAPKYVNAVLALDGDTSGPPRDGDALALTSSSSGSAGATSTSSRNANQTVTVTAGGGRASGPPVSTSKSDSGHQGGIANGTLVGVGVAVAVLVIGMVGLGTWAFMRRRRRRNGGDEFNDKGELAKQPSTTTLSELSGQGRVVEAGDGIPPPEMDSTNIRAELEGDCSYEASEIGTPIRTLEPLTPITPSINGEETLWGPTSPTSGV